MIIKIVLLSGYESIGLYDDKIISCLLFSIVHFPAQSEDDDDITFESYRVSRNCVVSVQSCTTPQPIEQMDLPKSVSPIVRNEMPSRPLPKSFTESMRMPSIVETLSRLQPRKYHSVTLGNACKLLWQPSKRIV